MLDDVSQEPKSGPAAQLALTLPHPRRFRPYFAVKRGLDIFLVLLAAPLWLPLIAVLALLVRRDGGRAFYTQPRLGLGGREFPLLKLRSMVPDAEARLARYLEANPAARSEWDAAQKLREDPRVTRLGRFMRKYSLDELPQLINVLRGEMSLVGPRPMFPAQRRLYPGTAYFDFRPGLTGLWQISERNHCSFAERARYDDLYAARVSLLTDVKVLGGTVGVVLRGTGL